MALLQYCYNFSVLCINSKFWKTSIENPSEAPLFHYVTFDFATWSVINRGSMVIKKSQTLQVWDKMTWFLLYWVDHTPRRAINCQLSLKSRRISSTCTFVAHFVFCVGRHSFETDGQRRVWCSYCLLNWAACRLKNHIFCEQYFA